MRPEYITFLKILRPVTRYAVDLTFSEIDSGELARPFQISRNEFLNSMYEDRGYEEFIYNFLRTAEDFFCIVGPRGSGKTSLGIKVKEALSKSRKHRGFIAFVDVRVQTNLQALESHTKALFRENILEMIKSRYMFDLFEYRWIEKDENPALRLWAYLLHRTDQMPSELFSPLWGLQSEAAQLFDAFRQSEPVLSAYQRGTDKVTGNVTYYDWLLATHTTDSEVRCLVKDLARTVKVPHLVYAARYIHKYDLQVIWFDNIDALPLGLQSEAVNQLKGIHGLVSSYVSTVVSVREENVFKQYDLEPGAPPHLTRVVLDARRDQEGHYVYSEADLGNPSFGVPILKSRVLDNIIQRRLDFTRNYQVQQWKMFDSSIKQEEERLKTEKDRTQQLAIQTRIETLQEVLSDFSPVIEPEQYAYVTQLSKKMLHALDREKAIYLANNSVRDFLMIFRDFLAELLKSPKTELDPPEALSYSSHHISTIFFRWIRSTRRAFRIGTDDIIVENQQWHEQRQSTNPNLHHLVITTIWNLILEKVSFSQGRRRYMNPTVQEVVSRLALVGFDREDVLSAIHSLYDPHEASGQAIEFRSRIILERPEQIQDDHIVSVTYRGKCLVGFTYNTFGYIYECIRRFENLRQGGDGNEDVSLHHQHLPETEYAATIMPYLCDIAQMHYTLLKNSRETAHWQDEAWLVKYYSWFGVPQLLPYRSRQAPGISINGVKRALQFECLMLGVLSYLRDNNGQLPGLAALFAAEIDRLRTFQDNDEEPPDFRAAFGLPPRSSTPNRIAE